MSTLASTVLSLHRSQNSHERRYLASLLATAFFLGLVPFAGAETAPSGSQDLPARIVAREHQLRLRLDEFHPLVETYVQVLKADHGQVAPWYDRHFLGVATFRGGLQVARFKPRNAEIWRDVREYADSFNPTTLEYNPAGFVAMAYPESGTFDLQHYRFQYSGTENLGDVRCFVFDVQPSAERKQGLFRGKIWVEDQDLTIIRFNGAYDGSNIGNKYFHFDSWRVKADANLWVPAAIYSDEDALPCCGFWKLNWTKIRFRSETRFWGYDPQPRSAGIHSASLDSGRPAPSRFTSSVLPVSQRTVPRFSEQRSDG
jgi:hypothetical protein